MLRTKTYHSILLFVLVCPPLAAGVALTEDDPAALRARLHQAEQTNTIDDPALRPWHLKMTVQLNDAKGKPSETAIIEEWWAGPAKDRRVFTSPSYTATELRTEKGLFRTPGTGAPPYLLERLRQETVHPLPTDGEIDQAKLDLRKQTIAKLDLDCIMLDEPIKGVAYPPVGLFPTYCLTRDRDTLRLSSNFGNENALRNAIGDFQGRHVPIMATISQVGVVLASSHVETLQTIDEAAGKFDDTDGLVEANMAIPKISSGLMEGFVLNKVAPIYPPEAKRRGARGTVNLHAIIGRDGHVHSLRLISTPDADLAMAAIAAVRQWTYRPYILNGVPTEVDTTIEVNFNLM